MPNQRNSTRSPTGGYAFETPWFPPIRTAPDKLENENASSKAANKRSKVVSIRSMAGYIPDYPYQPYTKNSHRSGRNRNPNATMTLIPVVSRRAHSPREARICSLTYSIQTTSITSVLAYKIPLGITDRKRRIYSHSRRCSPF